MLSLSPSHTHTPVDDLVVVGVLLGVGVRHVWEEVVVGLEDVAVLMDRVLVMHLG
jgi:hypothetical protein